MKTYGKLLLDTDSRWFMFFYFITFGGFVGLASALPLYFTSHFHVTPVAAGLMVSLIVFFGSTFRPVGGAIADRVGGIKSLTVMFCVVAACYFAISQLPEGPAPAGAAGWALSELPPMAGSRSRLFSLGTLCLGMGNGAVFQLLPQRFRGEVGVMTGLVGFAGGLGGFFLAKAHGHVERHDRRLHGGLFILRLAGVARRRRADVGKTPLADHLGRGLRRPHLAPPFSLSPSLRGEG